jgi:hypothetical protein
VVIGTVFPTDKNICPFLTKSFVTITYAYLFELHNKIGNTGGRGCMGPQGPIAYFTIDGTALSLHCCTPFNPGGFAENWTINKT